MVAVAADLCIPECAHDPRKTAAAGAAPVTAQQQQQQQQQQGEGADKDGKNGEKVPPPVDNRPWWQVGPWRQPGAPTALNRHGSLRA
jgi:hypothetical protein